MGVDFGDKKKVKIDILRHFAQEPLRGTVQRLERPKMCAVQHSWVFFRQK
jgi:hypothetical protein